MPDVSTVEAIKQLLLKAKTVAVPGSTSGIWLRTDLFPRLGIVEKIPRDGIDSRTRVRARCARRVLSRCPFANTAQEN